MGAVLLASIGFAILMEMAVVPSFNFLLADSRWSPLSFIGALLFLYACANLLYSVDCRRFTYDTPYYVTPPLFSMSVHK